MPKLKFSINIDAPSSRVWQTLWNDPTYRLWTAIFTEGSYAVSDWKQGSKIQFLTPAGEGLYSIINQSRANEYMSFKHLGIIKDFQEQPIDDETSQWSGAEENYKLTDNNGNTTLDVELDTMEPYMDYFKNTFPKAIARVKELCEM